MGLQLQAEYQFGWSAGSAGPGKQNLVDTVPLDRVDSQVFPGLAISRGADPSTLGLLQTLASRAIPNRPLLRQNSTLGPFLPPLSKAAPFQTLIPRETF